MTQVVHCTWRFDKIVDTFSGFVQWGIVHSWWSLNGCRMGLEVSDSRILFWKWSLFDDVVARSDEQTAIVYRDDVCPVKEHFLCGYAEFQNAYRLTKYRRRLSPRLDKPVDPEWFWVV